MEAMFLAAVQRGEEEAVTQYLSQHGTMLFDVTDSDGRNCLHLSAAGGHTRLMQILTWNGYDLNTPGEGGVTALHEASNAGQTRAAHFLLAMGGDVSAVDKHGLGALHYAARAGHLDTCMLLIGAGCDITATTVSRLTATHYAALGGHLRILQLLIKHGATLDQRASDNRTPLDMAQAGGHDSCVDYIRLTLSEVKSTVSLPPIEDQASLEAKLLMSEEKVEAMRARTKSLLQTKHDEMKAILKSHKHQHMEKMQQLKAESDEKLKELGDLHRLQVEKLRAQLDEHRLLLAELQEQANLCTCQAPRETLQSTKASLDILASASRSSITQRNTSKPSSSDEASPHKISTPLIVAPQKVDVRCTFTPPIRRKEKSSLPRNQSFDDPLMLPAPGPSLGLKVVAETGLSRSLSNVSSGAIENESSTLQMNTRHRSSGRVPDSPSPLANHSTGGSLLRVQTEEKSLRSPSLTDLHEMSLHNVDTMHGQKQLLVLDLPLSSSAARARSPRLHSKQKSPTKQSNLLPNSGRSPGSLPHLEPQ